MAMLTLRICDIYRAWPVVLAIAHIPCNSRYTILVLSYRCVGIISTSANNYNYIIYILQAMRVTYEYNVIKCQIMRCWFVHVVTSYTVCLPPYAHQVYISRHARKPYK